MKRIITILVFALILGFSNAATAPGRTLTYIGTLPSTQMPMFRLDDPAGIRCYIIASDRFRTSSTSISCVKLK